MEMSPPSGVILTLSSDAPTRRRERSEVPREGWFLEKFWGWGAGWVFAKMKSSEQWQETRSHGGRGWCSWHFLVLQAGTGSGDGAETRGPLRRKEKVCTAAAALYAFFGDLGLSVPGRLPGIALKYGNCSHWSRFRAFFQSRGG